MQVPTITMDPRIAKIHYSDYLAMCRKQREPRKKQLEKARLKGNQQYRKARAELKRLEHEERTLITLYRTLRKAGTIIVNLDKVFKGSGLDEQKLPKLAVARAHRKWCYLERSRNPETGRMATYFVGSPDARWHGDREDKDKVLFSIEESVEPFLGDWNWRRNNGCPSLEKVRAAVPLVPPQYAPADLAEGKYHILWEAVWEEHAPVDPLLLKHLTGSFYVVLAQWDLTPLEQQVIDGRFG